MTERARQAMSPNFCQSAIMRFLVVTTYISVILAWDSKNDESIAKRDTTLNNVKAMYNRFVSTSIGKARYVKGAKNACSLLDLPPSVAKTPGMLKVAASKDDFQSSLGCGVCLMINGSGTPAAADLAGAPPVKGTLNAIVVDQDDTISQGDLALLPPQSGSGLWLIAFKAVDCPTGKGPTGFIQFRLTGSNEMHLKLQASNAKVPVAGIEAFERAKGKWICLKKTSDNYFSNEGEGAISFPLKVRLTSIMNEQLEATIDALKNDVAIKSGLQFSDTAGLRGGSPEKIKCYGQGNRPSSDKGHVPFCVSKEDGIYADPIDQAAFYMCEGKRTTKKLCPWGLVFNPMISVCDYPENVKFVWFDPEAGTGRKIQSKKMRRGKSSPGNAGKSVGGPEEYEKHKDKASALSNQKPHKVFSINIFKGDHAAPKISTENETVDHDKEQSNAKLKPHPSATKELFQYHTQNTANHSMLQNKSRSMNQTLKDILQFSDEKQREETTSNSLPQRFFSSGKSSSFSPRKMFAINLFGLKPKDTLNDMQVTNESAGLMGQPSELSRQFADEQVFSHKVPETPLYTQKNDTNVPNISEIKSEKDHHQLAKQLEDLGNKRPENKLPAAVDAMPSPLHLKLKVQMDHSGQQPALNCTLSECSEMQHGLPTPSGSIADSINNYGSQVNETDGEFHVVLNTAGSNTLNGSINPGMNIKVAGLQQVLPLMAQGDHPQTDTSQPQMLNKTLTQFTQDFRDNTTSKLTAASQGKNDLKVENSEVEQATIQGENYTTSSKILPQNLSTSEHFNQGNGFPVSRIPWGRKYEGNMLKNTHPIREKESVATLNRLHTNEDKQGENKETSDHRLKNTSRQDSSSNNNEPQIYAQRGNQSYLQVHRAPPQNQPQLKIILKNPGKLGSLFKTDSAQLKKRSSARSHTMQIVKSLMKKTHNLRSGKAHEGLKLSNAVKKSMSGKISQSIDDLEHIKDSGSIAQSILEANKEYLDDVAMQGMIFSDGDPDTENMTDIADSIKQDHKFLEQTSEFSQWGDKNGLEDVSSPDQTGNKQDGKNNDDLMQQDRNEEVSSASAEGDSNKNKTSTKPSKIETSPGLDGSRVFMNNKDALTVTVDHPKGEWELIPYKGGKVKSTADPRLIYFCIGKTSGFYANPFERKSFLICSNGQAKEMECPDTMQFNIKEKICDIPDKIPEDKKMAG